MSGSSLYQFSAIMTQGTEKDSGNTCERLRIFRVTDETEQDCQSHATALGKCAIWELGLPGVRNDSRPTLNKNASLLRRTPVLAEMVTAFNYDKGISIAVFLGFLAVLGFELRAFHFLGRCSSTYATSPALIAVFIESESQQWAQNHLSFINFFIFPIQYECIVLQKYSMFNYQVQL
jgi:hypothetical protein